MELPIDHFRLLGVSPSAGAEEILRVFQLRLDRAPDQGFTEEVLAQRAELLRLSADLLTDQFQRQEYEGALSLGASGLELSSNREVAGLILLWEAACPGDAFKLARQALQPPQTPALGSSREADLALLAALACRDASISEQDRRRYAVAAEVLQEGILLLQRMGKLSDQRQILEEDLELLLPFRILDLLSRDLSDNKSHQEGLNLLDFYVIKRGGLEGKNKFPLFAGLKQVDFELFFQQVRKYITAQEQVELFLSWYRQGSADAGFLSSITLIALGFVYKQPQKLQEARRYLKNLNYSGLDPMPLIGCIDLLLGDIKQAEARFKSSNDENLRIWLENYPGEDLAAYCHYCRNWLQNDVLNGYRDIDSVSPDLDDWFADQTVQDYLDDLENRGARGLANAGRNFLSSIKPEKTDFESPSDPIEPEGSLPMPGGIRESASGKTENDQEEFNNLIPNISLFEKFINLSTQYLVKAKSINIRKRISKNPIYASLSVFFLVFITGTAYGLLNLRVKNVDVKDKVNIVQNEKPKNQSNNKNSISENQIKLNTVKNSTEQDNFNISLSENKNKAVSALSVDEPTDQQIRLIIEKWLEAKAALLSGEDPSDFSSFARDKLFDRVMNERKRDIKNGQKQIIKANILEMNFVSVSNKRISVNVKLDYKDKIINDSGDELSETVIPSLKVQYILGREKDIWQLVDYVSGI